MDWIQILGYVAGFLTTVAFMPQAVQTWKTQSAKDLSLPTFLLFSGGVFCWLVYGIYKEDLPIIIANSVTFVLAVSILIFKIRSG
jgi:MtN3 and saliva related transmembrane protein